MAQRGQPPYRVEFQTEGGYHGYQDRYSEDAAMQVYKACKRQRAYVRILAYKGDRFDIMEVKNG